MEVSRAFGEEGGDAFLHILGSGGKPEGRCFELETVGEAAIEPHVNGLNRKSQRERGIGEHFEEELPGEREEFRGGDDIVDETDFVGPLGGDGFAGEEQFERDALADEAGEALGSAVAGDDAEFDLGLAEFGVFGGDADGAGHGHFESAAEGEAVEGGEDGLAEGFELAEERLAFFRLALGGDGGEGGEFADVGAGDEGAVARTGEEEGADGGVLPDFGEEVGEFGQGLGVEGVQFCRAIKSEGGDAVIVDSKKKEFGRHMG